MKTGIFVLLAAFLLMTACSKEDTMEKQLENSIEDQTGNDVDVEINTGDDNVDMTMEADDGTTIEMHGENTDDWCAAGSTWNMANQDAESQMMIVGIVEGGEYDGYCHVTYDVQSEDTNADIDYYFDEEGSGYQVMVVNGQTFKTEWTAEN
ncbi:hypothetical protein JW868_01080 [Candidatus Woesearchaeota archaeon]|nr:hypothetical protein [Candidatus Woesearchaeota archaeon]